MEYGKRLRITGQIDIEVSVVAATKTMLIVEQRPGLVITLRRDPASTTPHVWRCAGLPVEVKPVPDRAELESFRTKLNDLELRTRDLV